MILSDYGFQNIITEQKFNLIGQNKHHYNQQIFANDLVVRAPLPEGTLNNGS